jgi:5-(carboxyamino)imidazole ribonucleotide mutase
METIDVQETPPPAAPDRVLLSVSDPQEAAARIVRPRQDPRIGIILGSSSDLRLVTPCMDTLDSLGETYEMIVASAHRTPHMVSQWAEGAASRGLRVIIAAAGAAAALPGVVAAHTPLPVVGLPLDASSLRGVDSLYAIVQMPPGIPVATVGINNAVNAAVLAVQILGATDLKARTRLAGYRLSLEEQVKRANRDLYAERPELCPENLSSLLGPAPAPGAGGLRPASPPRGPSPSAPSAPGNERRSKSAESSSPPVQAPPRSRAAQRIRVDPESPSPQAIERAVDVMLDGGVVAMPTDTVYGLAVDASRPLAVRKLFALKGRSLGKAIPVLVHSQSQVNLLASEKPPETQRLLERFWPGPLTVVFRKYAGSLPAVSQGETIGVRMPGSKLSLEVLSSIARPLAVTSANVANEQPARDCDTIEREFGARVDLILDVGPLAPSADSTVLDVSVRPFRILREGALRRDELAAFLGEALGV